MIKSRALRPKARQGVQPAPTRPRPTRLSRGEAQALTRSRLLASAREVVAREGYENASIDLIAENAGYSKGAFYSNFESKEAIFLELLEKHASEDVPEIARLLEGVDEPLRMIDIISNWAASRARDGSWGVLALELMRRARLEQTFGARHVRLFKAQYEGLGRILLRMFPEGAAPESPEVLGGLVFELTYGSSSAFTHRPGVGTLVKVTLTALYRAYGRR